MNVINFKPDMPRRSTWSFIGCVAVIFLSVAGSLFVFWWSASKVHYIQSECKVIEAIIHDYDSCIQRKNSCVQILKAGELWERTKNEQNTQNEKKVEFFHSVCRIFFSGQRQMRNADIKNKAVVIKLICPSLADALQCCASLKSCSICESCSIQSIQKLDTGLDCTIICSLLL